MTSELIPPAHFCLPEEIWRPIRGWCGLAVSNCGRIASCRKSSGRSWKITETWKELSTFVRKSKSGKDKSLVVGLSAEGRTKVAFVAKLVLEMFVGNADSGMQACHYPDRDPNNCRLENLRWDTPYNNSQDKWKHGTVLFGESHPLAKMTYALASKIREDVFAARAANNGKTPRGLTKSLSRTHKVDRTLIQRIVSGKRWNLELQNDALSSISET